MSASRFRTRLSVVALAVSLSPMSPAASQQAPPRDVTDALPIAGTATIRGVVLDEAGKPMRLVAVRVEGDPRANRTVMTTDEGRFAFEGLPAGEFFLRASKPAYPEVSWGAKRPGRPGARLHVKDGAVIDGIELRLERGAVITGTVFDEAGRPAPNTRVTVGRGYTAIDGSFRMTYTPNGRPMTDDRGQFRFYGLPAGDYIVGTYPIFTGELSARMPTDAEIREVFERANRPMSGPGAAPTAPPKVPPVEQPHLNYARVFYPDAPSPESAAKIHVVAGETHDGADLHMTLRPMAAISGRVTNVPDDARMEIMLADHGRGSTLFTGVNNDRTFRFAGLPPGDYTVIVRTSRDSSQQIASQTFALSGRDVPGVNLVLGPPLRIAGRVSFEPGAEPAAWPRLSVTARPVGYNAVAEAAAVNRDGTFEIVGLLPGPHYFTVFANGASGSQPRVGVVSVVLGGQDITDVVVDVPPNGMTSELALTLSDKLPELSGQLTRPDGSPATDYSVIAVASDEKYWLPGGRRIRSARPDATGRYTFRDLPAGTYRIGLTTDLDSSDLQNRDFLRQLMAAAAEVTIARTGTTTLDLRVGG